jgi:hypothetical protein
MARIRVRANGGRPAKDMMWDRRIRQESARAAPPVVVGGTGPVMGFGKYKGYPVVTVDHGYLVWCRDKMERCPPYILKELDRRSQFLFHEHPPTRKQSKADAQRRRAHQKLEEMKAGLDIEGSEYRRLRLGFDQADGDPEACPFDCEDYTYTGPTIGWMGCTLQLVPSQFPREFQ